MNITTYIIDDEFHAIEMLKDYIEQTPGMVLIGTSTDPIAGLEAITNNDPPQLLFLDVTMPRLNGLQLAGMVNRSTLIVFTTSYREFGPEAYELGAAYYLLKPFSYEHFLKCFLKLKELFTPNRNTVKEPFSFFVKTDVKGKIVRVLADEIRYISSEQNYLHIHLDNEVVRCYLTLKELLDKLPPGIFCRVHRGYIVNLHYVRSVEHGFLRLNNQALIDIGPAYRDGLMKNLQSTLIVSERERSK